MLMTGNVRKAVFWQKIRTLLNHEMREHSLPACLAHSGDFAAIGKFPKANSAKSEIPHIGAFSSASKAAAHNAG